MPMLLAQLKDALFLAPMEGVTDECYRLAVDECFPEWDHYACDFLRIPSSGHYKDQHVIKHFGQKCYQNEQLRHKTIYQVLTSPKGNIDYTVKQIQDLDFPWLDLNLGCPSRKVNAHFGGAYLLDHLQELEKIIHQIRSIWKGTFTVKMRVGYKDDKNFVSLLKMFEHQGVDAVTIHARTRDQLYKGVANWDYIKQAVQVTSLPVVANGDVWTPQDIKAIKEYTHCYATMFARGALKTPWLPKLGDQLDSAELLQQRRKNMVLYFNSIEAKMREASHQDEVILKKFKALSRYIFDDFPQPELTKRCFLRSKSLAEFKHFLVALSTGPIVAPDITQAIPVQ